MMLFCNNNKEKISNNKYNLHNNKKNNNKL